MCEIAEIIPLCGPNPPGLTELYWAEVADVATIPLMNAGNLTISSDIVMETGKTFKRLAIIREEGNFTDEMLGPTDSNHHTHQVMGKVKGMTPAVDAALNNAVGSQIIVLAKFPNGNIRLIGNKVNYAELVTMKSDSGKLGSTDRSGTEIVIKSVGHKDKAPYYTGEMPI